MKLKTSELTGAALDWAVAVAEHGKHDWRNPEHVAHFNELRNARALFRSFRYTEDWGLGGTIIEQKDIDVFGCCGAYRANLAQSARHPTRNVRSRFPSDGHTKLIAAMRCYVASRLGDEVDVPEELA